MDARPQVVDAPVADLHPHPRNPRTIRPERLEQLKRTLTAERGMLDARPLIALPDGTVIAGNQRLQAAIELGWETIPTVYADLDADQQTRWMLLDNRPFGADDDEAVSTLLGELRERGSDLDLTGYTRQETDQLIRKLTARDADPDEVPDAPVEARSRTGEVYELGPHRLMCGDATLAEDMETLMREERADVVFIDPPYAIYGSSSGLSSSITDDKIVRPFFRDALAAAQTWTPHFAPIFVCCDWRSWPSWWEVSKLLRIDPKNLIVWDKGGAGLGNNFANTYELIGYFIHLPEQKVMTAGRKAGIRPILKPNVLRANRATGSERQHNAAKPIPLIVEILDAASSEGDIVLDYFGGSGSTLIAADSIKRRAYLMEIDPVYCDVIRQRYADYTNQTEYAP